MTTRPLDPPPDSIIARIAAKRANRPPVDVNGRPIDVAATRTVYDYDAHGRFTGTRVVSNDDSAGREST